MKMFCNNQQSRISAKVSLMSIWAHAVIAGLFWYNLPLRNSDQHEKRASPTSWDLAWVKRVARMIAHNKLDLVLLFLSTFAYKFEMVNLLTELNFGYVIKTLAYFGLAYFFANYVISYVIPHIIIGFYSFANEACNAW
jgi:hypothetical protein